MTGRRGKQNHSEQIEWKEEEEEKDMHGGGALEMEEEEEDTEVATDMDIER